MATAIPRGRVSHPRDALSEWCSEGAIGGANEGTIDVAPGSLHQALGPIAGVLRAGGRHAITQAAIGLKVEDERRKSLAEKGWARRAVVVRGVGPCGGADLEQLPWREVKDTIIIILIVFLICIVRGNGGCCGCRRLKTSLGAGDVSASTDLWGRTLGSRPV